MKSPSEQTLGVADKFLHLIESVPGSDRLLLRIAFLVVVGTGIWLLLSINQQYSAVTPTKGGSFTEGILGTPRFVNPVLALTRADQDVTALVYSGLMKIGADGNLVPDAAESVTVSEDGLTYNVVLRTDVYFHDDTPLTVEDVIYTLQLIQDPDLKSPLRGNWTDVVIEKVGEHELNIILEEAYAPFIENFTFGIMPAHLWSSLPIEQLPFSQLNTEPIGSGPFKVIAAKRDTSGIINHYTLAAFRNNAANPNIDTIELSFYQSEEQLLTALEKQEIDATTYVTTNQVQDQLSSPYTLIERPLPRTFGIFFNQNKSIVLRDSAVREALTLALDRDVLIEDALFGHGVPIFEPTTLLATTIESDDSLNDSATSTPRERAIHILEEGGWKRSDTGPWEKEIDDTDVTLRITIRTSSVPLFESLINAIVAQWEAIGVEVVTEQFEQTGLVTSVIRPRDFEALLFGLDMNRSGDLYPFWHSSQQDDPGLNIAQYANSAVDELLETARTEQEMSVRLETLQKASNLISSEYPAIFLFQPTLTYIVNEKVTVTGMNGLGKPSDRWNNITEWHTESDSLWPTFRDDV